MDKSKIALEDEISRVIMAENGCTTHFEYKDTFSKRLSDPALRQITVMTYSKEKQASFLLKEVVASTDEEGLKEILKYAKSHKDDYVSFTVVWVKKGDGNKSEKSYFYCKDLFDVLEKFYFKKNREDYVIYEVKMNARA